MHREPRRHSGLSLSTVAVFWHESDPGVAAESTLHESLLGSHERRHAERIADAGDRRLYVIARSLLRRSLSRFAPVEPDQWRFDIGPSGKPEIGQEFRTDLRFSVSHTQGCVACAIGRRSGVGVDVESLSRPTSFQEIPEQFFAPTEQAWIVAAPLSEQRERFLRLWTLKEACLKALGVGLSAGLDQCVFHIGDTIRVEFGSELDASGDWRFDQRVIGNAFMAAVAVNAASVRFTYERD